MKKFFLLSLIVLSINVIALEPNPPTWPTTVSLFLDDSAPAQAAAQMEIDAVYATNGGPGKHGQFTGSPHAFLFGPGNFNTLNVRVGYYTSVIGLGETPDNTIIQHVHQSDIAYGSSGIPKVLDMFWRSAENFKQGQDSLTWAVSQAAPLRSVHAKEVSLSKDGAEASGGFFANCQFDVSVSTETQQQWCARNSFIGQLSANNISNMVLVGCTFGQTASGPHLTFITQTPAIAEKPYITIDTNGFYYLQVPTVKFATSGPSYNSDATSHSFTGVYVASDTDPVATINAKIDEGNHVILTPGTYNLRVFT